MGCFACRVVGDIAVGLEGQEAVRSDVAGPGLSGGLDVVGKVRFVDAGRGVVVVVAEVRAAQDREVVRGARVGQGVVVVGDTVSVDEAVEIGHGGVADDVAVAVVLHVDQEHMVEWADGGGRSYRRRRRGKAHFGEGERDVVGVGIVVMLEQRVQILQRDNHFRGGGAHRNVPGGLAVQHAGLQPPIENADRPDRGDAQRLPRRPQEGDGNRGPGSVDAEAAEVSAECVRRCGGGDLGCDLAEIHRLGQGGAADGSAAEELCAAGVRPGTVGRESKKCRQRRIPGLGVPHMHLARSPVPDDGGGAGHRPARDGHRAVAGQRRITHFGATVDEQVRAANHGPGVACRAGMTAVRAALRPARRRDHRNHQGRSGGAQETAGRNCPRRDIRSGLAGRTPTHSNAPLCSVLVVRLV